jgi:thiamine pyrophosphate-dependent acetolactate synthase large subunit-like protein
VGSRQELTAPVGRPALAWGSDAIAELLRALELRYISLNPGASYRGLHDSLVNYLGNERPEIVLCLHEEHAVAVAHGFAKVTEQPMAVALHSNVGLMHASMALFNAYCDRVPMLVLGATGPVDAPRRRPWIDWIHTAADQAALVRPSIKWDDQPASTAAALESLVRADALTRTYPAAPVYVCLDAHEQETPVPADLSIPDPSRHRPPAPPSPGPDAIRDAARLLLGAERPLILAGRVTRSIAAWDERVRLAERLGARVLTDLRTAAAFPSGHHLHAAVPGTFLTPSGAELLQRSDVVLALDWVDLGGTLRQAFGTEDVPARVISCSLDATLHNGWSKDHFELPTVDLAIASHPDLLVHELLAAIGDGTAAPPAPATVTSPARDDADAELTVTGLASALRHALAGVSTCLVRVPLSWRGEDWSVEHPLDYLGQDGGAGLGSGPGMAVGAALALQGTDRLAVAILGDGDVLMGATALWTAAHCRLPLLVVVANNGTYLNDEIHQERVARARERPVANRWVGQRIADPDPDLAALGRSMGLAGHGPVEHPAQLADALSAAVRDALAGEAVVVDVRVRPTKEPT